MPEITFENDNLNSKYKSRVVLGQPVTPNMVKFLTTKGIVKNEKQAMTILSIVAVLFFTSSIFIIYTSFFQQPDIQPLSPEEEILLREQGLI